MVFTPSDCHTLSAYFGRNIRKDFSVKISTIKSINRQQRLFEQPMNGHAQSRNVLGEIVEDLAAALFNGVRHKTDCRCDYCPDVSIPMLNSWGSVYERIYLECKSAGRNRETFIYKGRLIKDRKFAANHLLFYVIFHHQTVTKQASTAEDLHALFLQAMQCIYFIPFSVIDEIASSQKIKRLNSGYGGTDRKTYGSGFRLKLSKFEKWKLFEWENS